MRISVPLVLVLAGVLAASCSISNSKNSGAGTNSGGQDAGGGVVLKPNVLVLADSVVAAATITANTITFPAAGNEALSNLAPGTVIVSGYQQGFILRVQSVTNQPATQSGKVHTLGLGSAATILYNTVSASLIDAIWSGSFDWTYTPTPLTADGTEVLSGTETTGFSITAQGNISPSIEVKGQITNGSVSSFETMLTTTVSDTVSESLMFDGSQSWSGSAPIPAASTSKTFVEFLGPVPVVGTVTLYVVAGYSASITATANVSLGETCSVAHTDTITYDPSAGWSADDSSTSNCMNQGPTLDLDGTASVKAYFSPSIQLSFYGIGGPSLAAEVGVEASITACPGPSTWSSDAYVSGTVGANVSVLGISQQFSKPLGKVTYPIANGTFATPSICGGDGGTDGGTDGGQDSGHDGGPDSGPDSGQDAGADAGRDSGDGGGSDGCLSDASIQSLGGMTAGACVSCVLAACPSLEPECNAICGCPAAFIGFESCLNAGGSLISCGNALIASGLPLSDLSCSVTCRAGGGTGACP